MNLNEDVSFLVSSPCCSENCVHNDDNCFYQIAWEINPHMKIGSVNCSKAIEQHQNFIESIRLCGANILELPFLHGVFDSVFSKDNALVVSDGHRLTALLTNPATSCRAIEQDQRKVQLERFGIKVSSKTKNFLEGGDVIVGPKGKKVFFGYGQRSQFAAIAELRDFFKSEVVPLELVDPYFFHLDTALNFVDVDGKAVAFACKSAFSNLSWEFLINDIAFDAVIEVPREEALDFGLNWIEINETILLGSYPKEIVRILQELGKTVLFTPLSEFLLAGGSAACLANRIHVQSSVSKVDSIAALAAQTQSRIELLG